MKLRVDELKGKVLHREAVESVEAFPILAEINGVDCVFLKPIDISVIARKEPDHIRVDATVSSSARIECSRCLENYDSDMKSEFTIYYREEDSEYNDEEVELSERDLVSSSYSGNEIDLGPEIAEQLLMEIPVKPLCREDCKGLCPTCGADLNRGACDCGRGTYNPKFSALKDFKVKK